MDMKIGGGFQNFAVGTGGAVGGGTGNQANGNVSFIGGGENNLVTQQGNAILGGFNNNDAGIAGAMIVGSNINAVNPNTLHIEGLWANNIPYNPGATLPQGTVFAMPFGTIPTIPLSATGGILWIV